MVPVIRILRQPSKLSSTAAVLAGVTVANRLPFSLRTTSQPAATSRSAVSCSTRRISVSPINCIAVPPQKSGEVKPVVLFFSDVAGFTSFSETLTPYDVMYLLNRYFAQVGELIERERRLY